MVGARAFLAERGAGDLLRKMTAQGVLSGFPGLAIEV